MCLPFLTLGVQTDVLLTTYSIHHKVVNDSSVCDYVSAFRTTCIAESNQKI